MSIGTNSKPGARPLAAGAALLMLVLVLGSCTRKTTTTTTTEGGGDLVRLTIDSPQNGDTLPGPDVEVRFTLQNYELFFDSSTGKGQHIHFILDNQPYQPQFQNAPWVFKNVAPGTHTVRAFPSRPWHESIKDSTAFAMVTFSVGAPDGKNAPDPAAPLLTYSRPKGDYYGHAADSILVDFWLKNAKLGANDYRVRLTTDGSAEEILDWAPLWKTGLALGPHTFKLELIAPDGSIAPGPFNVTERTIQLKADTTAAAAHTH